MNEAIEELTKEKQILKQRGDHYKQKLDNVLDKIEGLNWWDRLVFLFNGKIK